MHDVMLKARPIRLLVLDVDGVLSNGQLYFSNSGDEIKAFSTLDGLGIKLLQQAGIEVAIITGRQSEIVQRRASSLGITHIIQGREDKLTALEELRKIVDFPYQEIAYMGDDLPDLAAIRRVGLGITVPNGHHFVAQHADWCTQAEGGFGAVREACELILKAQGKLTEAWEAYL